MAMKQVANNLLQTLSKHLYVWWLTGVNTVQLAFVNRWSNLLFVVGKSIRLAMSLIFLFVLQQNQVTIAGYTSAQVIVFFLIYQLVDLVSQILYRGVYIFGNKVRTGEFDFYLIRPVSALFRALTGLPDINDLVFLIPNLAVGFWLIQGLDLPFTASSIALFGLLFLNAMLISTSLHILVLVSGILTTEVDNIIWTYRDLSRLGQFPVTMYAETLRWILFMIIPIGLMTTIPAQALLQQPLSVSVWLSLVIGGGFFGFSLFAWHWSLKRYTSASS